MFRHGRDVLVEMRAIGQPLERRITIFAAHRPHRSQRPRRLL